MKTMIIFLAAALFVLNTKAQGVLRYEFQNSLNEKNGNGPDLAVLGNPGIYVQDTLNEISGNTKIVYRFESNSGFQFNNAAAGNFIGDTYSIELYFVFDDLNSWKRVTDWKNRKTDAGAYVYYGQLNFYPYVFSAEAPVETGEYTYYVITRDGTGQLFIYTDADVEIDFMDSNGDALVDADNMINFFHDDLSVPNEASSGAVALLNLYNYVLDSTVIKENFENVGGQVFSINDIRKSATRMTVYPNPARESTTIDLSGFDGQLVTVEIYNAAGIRLISQNLDSSVDPLMQIHTSSYSEGIYFISARSDNYISTDKLMISH